MVESPDSSEAAVKGLDSVSKQTAIPARYYAISSTKDINSDLLDSLEAVKALDSVGVERIEEPSSDTAPAVAVSQTATTTKKRVETTAKKPATYCTGVSIEYWE